MNPKELKQKIEKRWFLDEDGCSLEECPEFQELLRVYEIACEIITQSPPPDWDIENQCGGLNGYGKSGDVNYVKPVKWNDHDGVWSNGMAVGFWFASNKFRKRESL